MNNSQIFPAVSFNQQQDKIVGKMRKIFFLILVLLIPNLVSPNPAEAKRHKIATARYFLTK